MRENSFLPEHVPFATDRQTLMSESAQVIYQHSGDELWVSLHSACGYWGSPQGCFQHQPHICCCLLSTDKFGCAEPGKELCFQLRHLQLLLTSQISCCSTISTSLLRFPRKNAASWVTGKSFKKQGEKMGKRRSEEVIQEGKEGINQDILPSLLQASWIHFLVDHF